MEPFVLAHVREQQGEESMAVAKAQVRVEDIRYLSLDISGSYLGLEP